MSWRNELAAFTLEETDTSESFRLGAKELAHVQVERTDNGSDDTMAIAIFASTDEVTWDSTPLIELYYDGQYVKGSFMVYAVRYFRITMNAIGTLNDITCNVKVSRDGGAP
jgi:hypothetical protein